MLTGGDYTDKASRRVTPRVWAVASYRAGENSQISGLANRLGGDVATKRLRYNSLAGPLGLMRVVSRRGIDAGSDVLEAPWPDIIVSAGLKNEPVCRWIKQCSGGHTRLVFLGRTWARRDLFDLVVTTPQYRLPREPNVVHNLMTQHGVTASRLAAERVRWEARFEELPRPILGVLIGGDSGPFVLGPRAARRLAHKIERDGEAARRQRNRHDERAHATRRGGRARFGADGAGVAASLSARRSRQSVLRHSRARRCVRRDVRQRGDAVRSGGSRTSRCTSSTSARRGRKDATTA